MKMNSIVRACIAVAIVLAVAVAFQAYQTSMKRRGGLAVLHFNTLADRLATTTELLVAKSTGALPESVVVAGSGSMQSMQYAELGMRWEICVADTSSPQKDLQTIADQIRPKLKQMIDHQQQVLRWHYPHLQMSFELSTTNSAFYHKPSLLLYLACNN